MVYVLLADGFEEIEAITPIDILRRGGIEVKTVGVTGDWVSGAHGIILKADVAIDSIAADDSRMIILPGGMPGTTNLKNSQAVADLLSQAFQSGVYLAAICAAPSVLGALGLLKGRRATCYPGFEQELDGATITDAPVVVDQKVVTSKGPGTAAQFAFTLLELLKDKKTVKSLKASMQYS